MKIAIREDMDVAEEMAWLVLGSRTQSNILKRYLLVSFEIPDCRFLRQFLRVFY